MMRDVIRFCRYAVYYLLGAPALRALGVIRGPLFLSGTAAFSLALSLAAQLSWAGEVFQIMGAASPDGSLTGATAVLGIVAVGCTLGVMAAFLGVIAVVGLIRGAIGGSRLVAKAWRVAPLEPWSPSPNVVHVVGCQVTDLHLCADNSAPYELEEAPELWRRGKLPDGDDVYLRAGAVMCAAAAEAQGALFVTGDATDRGEPAAWKLFLSLMRETPVENAWIVPGNHDVTFNSHQQPDYFLRALAVRRERFAEAAREAMRRSAQYPQIYAREQGDARATIVTLSSVEYRSDNLLSNAVGRFGESQLQRLAEMLNDRVGPVLVLCHHHLGPISQKRFRFDELLMNALDATRLLAVLSAYARRDDENQVLVIHGHRHVRSYGRLGDARVYVAGMPSSTLGEQDENGVFDGDLAFARVGFDRQGRWSVELKRPVYQPTAAAASPYCHPAAKEA